MQFEFPQLAPMSLPFGNISFFISTQILFVILGVFFVFYAIVSGVLIYHWSAYGMRHRGILVAESLYLAVSIALFIVAGLSILYY